MVGNVPYHIQELIDPVRIKNQYCTVLTVPDIEDAERICKQWNNVVVHDRIQKLKAHVHPYSYRRRPTDKLSLHPIFEDRYNPA